MGRSGEHGVGEAASFSPSLPCPGGAPSPAGAGILGAWGRPLHPLPRFIRDLGGSGGSVPVTSPPAEPPRPRDCGGAAWAVPPPPPSSGQPRAGVPPGLRTRCWRWVVPRRWLPAESLGSASPGLRGGGASPAVNRTWCLNHSPDNARPVFNGIKHKRAVVWRAGRLRAVNAIAGDGRAPELPRGTGMAGHGGSPAPWPSLCVSRQRAQCGVNWVILRHCSPH